MTTFVLVGGFWIGAWAWRDVADRLTAAGHRVYPLTMTGLGDRKHLATFEIGLETHITDVINFLEVEELTDVVLVGHSGSGAIIDCVADRIPERIGGLIYVDTGPIVEGTAIIDFGGPEERAKTEATVRNSPSGRRIPLPSWEELGEALTAGLDLNTLAWFRRLAVDQPYRVAADPVRHVGGDQSRIPKWAIMCLFPVEAVRGMIASGNPDFAIMGGPEWTLLSLPTGHWPMMSEPGRLSRMIAAWPSAERASAAE